MATYKKIGVISDKGAFSVVWEAERDDGTRWAMKVLRDGLSVEENRRFQREAKIASNLSHPSIVRIVGLGLIHNPPWFTMPIAESCMRDWMAAASESEKIAAFLVVAEALSYAHANNVIHRDLKPENVLMYRDKKTGDLKPVVADFGLGKMLDSHSTTLTSSNIGMGTIAYLAPEQLASAKTVDHRADIYSMGKILYELLTGLVPFPVLDHSKIPDRFVYPIRTATNNDPVRRFQSVADLIAAIETASGQHNFVPKLEDIKQQLALAAADPQRLASGFVRDLIGQIKTPGVLERLVPTIPRHLLRVLLSRHEDVFKPVVEAYAVLRPETFEYCDTIADFCQAVFDETDSSEIRQIVLERVFHLGPEYNRWHVGGVFGGMLVKLKKPDVIHFVADVFKRYPGSAAWHRAYMDESKLPRIIADALRKPASDEDEKS